MSMMSKLDQLAIEIYGEFGFETLTNFEKELVISLYELDSALDYTDFILNEQDNIPE